jgi:hypothetical protein
MHAELDKAAVSFFVVNKARDTVNCDRLYARRASFGVRQLTSKSLQGQGFRQRDYVV